MFLVVPWCDPNLIGRGSRKLPVQHIADNWHGVLAVGVMDEFESPDPAQMIGTR